MWASITIVMFRYIIFLIVIVYVCLKCEKHKHMKNLSVKGQVKIDEMMKKTGIITGRKQRG